ncbi:MAG: hypothetical protein HDT28_00785 [Clostridiales bacterium]|nr:hypothetical protein [Clostridiales bacterium]
MSDLFEKLINEFKVTMSLENTRRQYDIIELLATEFGKHKHVDEKNRDSVYCDKELFDNIFEFTEKETKGINSGGIGDSNPLCKYIKSRNKDELFNIGINDDDSINHYKLASLVTYFSLVRYYEGIIDKKHLGNKVKSIDRSDFDRIVEAIRRVLDVDICHFVSVKDGETLVLASSNERYYSYNELAEDNKLFAFSQLVMSGIDPIPYQNRNKALRTINDVVHEGGDEDWLLDRTISCKRVRYDKEHEMPVLIIRLSPDNSANNVYLIALLNDKEDGKINGRRLLEKAVGIVFLKSKLWRLVDSNYENLCSSRMRFDYIPRINKENLCVAYHISDLHVGSSHSIDDKIECMRHYFDAAESNTKKVKLLGIPELLLITGDICNYAPTAYELESNYAHAAQIIKHFVSCFWCVTEKHDNKARHFLRSDWKKRLVFCPGNHDYASMNELKASSNRRETTGGNPVEYSGGSIAKFTYYINALRKHFDVSDAHIDDKLNFVRYYKKIGAVIVSLNSCSEANSKLQNKAHIDFDQANIMERTVKSLLNSEKKREALSPAVIVLSHHSYNYFPNYFKDRHQRDNQKEDTSVHDALSKINIRHNFERNIVIQLNELANNIQEKSREKIGKRDKDYKKLIARIFAILFALRFSGNSDEIKEFREKAFRLYSKAYGLDDDAENDVQVLYNRATTEMDELIKETELILDNNRNEKEFITLSELFYHMTEDRFYIEKGTMGMKASKEDSRVLLRLNAVCSDIEESIADYEALKKIGELFIKEDNTHWLSGHVHEDAVANAGLFKNNDRLGIYDELDTYQELADKTIGEYGKAHEAQKFSGGKGLNVYSYVHNFKNETVSYQSLLELVDLENSGNI